MKPIYHPVDVAKPEDVDSKVIVQLKSDDEFQMPNGRAITTEAMLEKIRKFFVVPAIKKDRGDKNSHSKVAGRALAGICEEIDDLIKSGVTDVTKIKS